MATPPGSLIYWCHLNINYKGQGKSEQYALAAVPSTDASPRAFMAQALQIAWGRTAFFGEGTTLVNARVSSSDPTHDGARCALPYPLGVHPRSVSDTILPVAYRDGTINEPNDCIQMRFETSQGLFWQRYFNFIRDSWISDTRLVDPVLLPYLTPSPGNVLVDMSDQSPGSMLQICQSFWSYLLLNTRGAQKVSKGYYSLVQAQFAIFAQIASKKVGRAFGVPRGRRQKTLIS